MKTKLFSFSIIFLISLVFVLANNPVLAADKGADMTGDASMKAQEHMTSDAPIFVGPVALQRIQQELKRRGYKVGPVDGIWGDMTASGLKQFQQVTDLAPTGNLDIQTLQAMGFSEILKGKLDEIATVEKDKKPQGQGVQLFISPTNLQQIQEALQNQGFKVGTADGMLGEQTQQAIQDFQKEKGFASTGHVTLGVLEQLGMTQMIADLGFIEEPGYPELEGNMDKRVAQMERAGMDVKTTTIEENEMAQQMPQKEEVTEDERRIARLEAGGMDVETEMADESGMESQIARQNQSETDRQVARLEEAGMDIKTAPAPSNEASQGMRGYYGEAGSKPINIMQTGAPLFAGPDVIRQVQTALNEDGYKTGNTEGKWSEATALAIGRYQSEHDLASTGTLTLATLNKLIVGNMSSLTE